MKIDVSRFKNLNIDLLADWQTTAGSLLSHAEVKHLISPKIELARQLIIFGSLSININASHGAGMVLVELLDGRVFFFRTRLAMLKQDTEINFLLNELLKLTDWITDWRGASERVGFAIGAQMEFIDKNPELLDSWNIHEWRAQAVSWMALNQGMMSIQKIRSVTSEATEYLKDDLSAKITCFMSGLERNACEFAKNMQSSWQSSYNYMVSGVEQQRLYRRQAAKSLPVVIQQILANPKEESAFSIRMAIDKGLPLVDHVTKLFKCSKASVRHLNSIGAEYIGTRWQGRIKELLVILSSLDVNKLPKSEHEWNVFDESIELLSAVTKMPTTSLSSRLLLGELSRLNWNRNRNLLVTYQERALLIEGFAGNIRHAIVAMGWINMQGISVSGWGTQRVASEAARSIGLPRLEKIARKWRTEELHLDLEISHRDIHEFPVLLENTMLVGDMSIVQMIDQKQLVEEGSRMQNCVASYATQCASGQSFIFSVRDKKGKSCVTVEYRLSRPATGFPEFVLIQKNGFQNTSPGSEFFEALRALASFVKSPDVKRKILPLLVYQKASGMYGENVASFYKRSLAFIKFLDKEAAGRFDFEKLVAETLREEAAFKEVVPNISKILKN